MTGPGAGGVGGGVAGSAVPVGDLQGRVALVTGAGRRIGRGVALALAAQGAQVVVHYRSRQEEAAAVVREIAAAGGRAFAAPAELRDPAAVEAMVGTVAARAGSLDILVNNVGTFLVKSIAEVTPAEWEQSLAATVTVTFLACRAALPGMVERGYGRIVNFADAGADHLRAAPNITPYLIGKTGVLILTKSLAAAYARHGITVNAVSPGIVDNSVTKPPGAEEAIPAGRFATIDDITNAVLFLLRDASSYITGANLKVGGGWHA